MIKIIPLSRIALALICCLLIIQNVFPKSHSFIVKSGFGLKFSGYQLEENERQTTLKAKSLAVYLEETWGESLINLEKWIYAPYPYDRAMSGPEYGYVKNFYYVDHWRFMDDPERYGAVAFVKKRISHLPYNERVYEYLQESDSFIEQPLPLHLKGFILFLHKDILGI